VRDDTFGISLLSSIAIHVCAILIASVYPQNSRLHRRDFVSIRLVDLPRPENPPAPKKAEGPPELKKSPPPKVEKPRETKPTAKAEQATPLPASTKDEPSKVTEAKSAAPAKAENIPSFLSGAWAEGGGSEAGAGNLSGKGDVGVIPGIGTGGGGGGTGSSGFGRGSGAPGLPAQTAPMKTNREAKPIQIVRAAYPPMALRAGLESDVTLRIEVDAEGKVTRAEVTKSGSGGFDEEALKAVKQSRFEAAQRDGQPVPAEFTYIYRFRLQR
jgi:TonB family protein